MKINEVERLVGITKVNIRFYEKENLLTPGRNSENGYRDYNEADVAWLKKVKLLRMLDVPLEEIRRLRAGEMTLSDVMGRHVIQLERRQSNLGAMQEVCQQLRDSRCQLEGLDVDQVLSAMERQEQEGTRFMDVKRKDQKTKYVAPFAAAAVTILLMGAVIALLAWGILNDPETPRWMIAFIFLPIIVMLGVIAACWQRVKQIRGGEEDAASQY